MERDDQDIEELLETTNWEQEPDPLREQASLARVVARLDRRQHRMHILARTSVAVCIAVIICTTGTTWYHWARPMAVAVQETQSLPVSVMRLVQSTSTKSPGTWHTLLARAAARDPRGLLTDVRTVPGTGILRVELTSGAGYILLLPGHGVVGVVAPSSQSAKHMEGFTAVTPADAPDITAQDVTAAREIVLHDAAVARVGSPTDDTRQVASVYQPTIPWNGQQNMFALDPFVFGTNSGYVHVQRVVAVPLKLQQENQTSLTALVDIDSNSIVGIVDTANITGIILTSDPGPQVVLTAQ